MKFIRVCQILPIASFFLLSVSLSSWAEDTPESKTAQQEENRDPASMSRGHGAESGYRSVPIKRRDDNMFGVSVQGYYDALSSYSKFLAGPYPSQFGESTMVGLGGMQFLITLVNAANFEFTTGFDYMFPVSVQGQQNPIGTYVVNNQTFNMMGVKLIQAGYQFSTGPLNVVPFAGFGIYYGRTVLSLNTNGVVGSFGQTDTVTYSKLMGIFNAGVRMDINLNDSHTFIAGLGLEMLVPSRLQDQLSQTGWTVQPMGSEQYLQPNLDFMFDVGGRVTGHVSVLF